MMTDLQMGGRGIEGFDCPPFFVLRTPALLPWHKGFLQESDMVEFGLAVLQARGILPLHERDNLNRRSAD